MLSTMETTMYEDNSRQALKSMKSNMTLDFSGPKTKQQKFVQGQLLSSPDMGLLKLASPELERMIIQQNGMVTTTPTPTQFLFPKSVSEEQEAYARGFVDALAELHSEKEPARSSTQVSIPSSTVQASSSQPQQTQASYATLTTVTVPQVSAASQAQASFQTTTPLPGSVVASSASQNVMTSGTFLTQQQPQLVSQASAISRTQSPLVHMPAATSTSTGLPQAASARLMELKEEEPQTVPCLGNTPPLSPIDMESQERIKLERKRARNRVAARKCRTRKLERISRLEDRVSDLKLQNTNLTQTASSLREQVFKLKQQIMEHVNSGCQVMLSPNLS